MLAYLETLKGCRPVTLIAETTPDLVAGNPFGKRLRKLAQVNGMIGWNYANAVNNQRCRENQPLDNQGNVEYFSPKPRKWGKRLKHKDGSLSALVEHKGQKYLEVKVQKSLQHLYFLDGKPVNHDVVKPWLRKTTEGKRQKVKRPVILRDYAIHNIKMLAIDGQLLTAA